MDLTPSKLEKAFERVSDVLVSVVFSPPGNTPRYLREVAALQARALDEGVFKRYITVGVGAYGSVGITVWGPEPAPEDLEELARWVRDKTGECSVPLYITYAGPEPPAEHPVLDYGGQAGAAARARAASGPQAYILLAAAASLAVLLAVPALSRRGSGRAQA